MRRSAFVLSFGLLLGCSDSEATTAGDDTGADETSSDTGAAADSSTPSDGTTDTGTPGTDTGTPGTDTGTPPADTGTPPADTGAPPADTGTPTDGGTGSVPTVGGCPMFTASDAWNTPIAAGATVDATWTSKLYANATKKALHPDFGTAFGIPFNVVPNAQPKLTIGFDYADESDPGPYPFPGASAKIEGGTPASCSGDCHVLTVQQGACLLYEGWDCHFTAGTSTWHCGSGARFDLTKNSYGQRPLRWTSADAAGLAILPGLVRYSEVAAGVVKHAIRFTMHCTQDGFVVPASHQAVPRGGSGCPSGISTTALRADYPPMGLRIRLKASYDISTMPTQAKVVAQAMKTYGMILADNGSDYYFQGDQDPGWNDSQLNALKAIPGDAFEVITPGTITR